MLLLFLFDFVAITVPRWRNKTGKISGSRESLMSLQLLSLLNIHIVSFGVCRPTRRIKFWAALHIARSP